MSHMGQKAKYSLRANVVRCCPDNRHTATTAPCPFGAMNRHRAVHSITASANNRNSRRITSPTSFAVFRLKTSSSFVGCSTGRSAGLAPLEDFVHIRGGASEQIRQARPVGHQAPILHKLPRGVHCREPVLRGPLHNAFVLAIYELGHCGRSQAAASLRPSHVPGVQLIQINVSAAKTHERVGLCVLAFGHCNRATRSEEHTSELQSPMYL